MTMMIKMRVIHAPHVGELSIGWPIEDGVWGCGFLSMNSLSCWCDESVTDEKRTKRQIRGRKNVILFLSFSWRDVTWEMICSCESRRHGSFNFLKWFLDFFSFLFCYFIGSWWKAIGEQFIIWLSTIVDRLSGQKERKQTKTDEEK